MTVVELEITPDPTPAERAAIEAAVAELLAEEATPASPWWEAGVLDAVESDEAEAPA